jgi:hypothetical protein
MKLAHTEASRVVMTFVSLVELYMCLISPSWACGRPALRTRVLGIGDMVSANDDGLRSLIQT